MKYWVYLIRSEKDGSLYKGLTNNLERRLKEHNLGENRSTKSKKPFMLIYSEECKNRIEARKREKYFKSGIGREQLNKVINIPR